MKKILLLSTGGTIATEKTENGLAPKLTSRELLESVPQVKSFCQVDAVQLFNIDSSNMQPENWVAIAQAIRDRYADYDGFLITHGTDTMVYTAAALSYLIQDSPKPIVLTGSQKSISYRDTDARMNLSDAFLYCCSQGAWGVHIVFGGKVIQGTRARKIRTKSFDAFDSINYPPVAAIRDGRLYYYIREAPAPGGPHFCLGLCPDVFLLKLAPGMDAGIFPALKARYRAMVIESFGVGGVPAYGAFSQGIQDWIDSGRYVVMATQVPGEGSDMAVYEVGYVSKKQYHLMEAYDMTTEAAMVKLMWLLGQGFEKEALRKGFYRPVQQDILTSETGAAWQE